MASFSYKGRDTDGKEVVGIINANSQDGVAEQLMKQKIIPIKITPYHAKNKLSIFKQDLFGKENLKREDMIILCRQLHTMIKVGIPIIDSLNHIAESTQCPIFAKILPQIAEAISGGQTFSDALKMHPNIFSRVLVNIIATGEHSGQLDRSFSQLADYLELENRSLKRIKSATRYPIIVIIAALGALCLINFLVIPSFADMFASFDTELPLITRCMISMSSFFQHYWPHMLGVILILYFSFKYYIKQNNGKFYWHKILLKMPIFGKILYNAILGRFSRMFAMMLETGIPLVEAIELVANTIGNSYVSHYILAMRAGIERGDSLTNAAKETNMFSPMILQMLTIGEETGSLDSLLTEVAIFYEGEVDYDLDRLGDMIEPVLLGFIGILVLLLALGIFVPMWDMVNFVKK